MDVLPVVKSLTWCGVYILEAKDRRQLDTTVEVAYDGGINEPKS